MLMVADVVLRLRPVWKLSVRESNNLGRGLSDLEL